MEGGRRESFKNAGGEIIVSFGPNPNCVDNNRDLGLGFKDRTEIAAKLMKKRLLLMQSHHVVEKYGS